MPHPNTTLSLLDIPNDCLIRIMELLPTSTDKLKYANSCSFIRKLSSQTPGCLGTLAILLMDRDRPPRLRPLLKDSVAGDAMALQIFPWGNGWTAVREMEVFGWLHARCRCFREVAVMPSSCITGNLADPIAFNIVATNLFLGSCVQYLSQARYEGSFSVTLPDVTEDNHANLLRQIKEVGDGGRLPFHLKWTCGVLELNLFRGFMEAISGMPNLTSLELPQLYVHHNGLRALEDALRALRPPPSFHRLLVGLSFDVPPPDPIDLSLLAPLTSLEYLGLNGMHDALANVSALSALTKLKELDLGPFDANNHPGPHPQLSPLSALTGLSTLRLQLTNVRIAQVPGAGPRGRKLDLKALPPLPLPCLRVLVLMFKLHRAHEGRSAVLDLGRTFDDCTAFEELGLRLECHQWDHFRPGRHLTLDLDPALAALPHLTALHGSGAGLRLVYSFRSLPSHRNLRSLVISGWAGVQIWGLNRNLGGPNALEAELRVPPAGNGPPALVLGQSFQLMGKAQILPECQGLDYPTVRSTGVMQHGAAFDEVEDEGEDGGPDEDDPPSSDDDDDEEIESDMEDEDGGNSGSDMDGFLDDGDPEEEEEGQDWPDMPLNVVALVAAGGQGGAAPEEEEVVVVSDEGE